MKISAVSALTRRLVERDAVLREVGFRGCDRLVHLAAALVLLVIVVPPARAERLGQEIGEVLHREGIARFRARQGAVAGVVERDEHLDAGRGSGLGDAGVEFALVLGMARGRAAAGVAEAALLRDLDELDIGHGGEQRGHALGDAGDALVLVDGDALARQVGAEFGRQARQRLDQELGDVAELESGLGVVVPVLAELLGAGRAPGQDALRRDLGEGIVSVARDLGVGVEIGLVEMIDAAAMAGPAHHLERDAERLQDVHDVEHEVRRPQHVAAGVEDEVRRAGAMLPVDAIERVRRRLHAREEPHRMRHGAEAPPRRLGALGGAVREPRFACARSRPTGAR